MSDHKHDFSRKFMIPTIYKSESYAIIVTRCECGKHRTLDYGQSDTMIEKYATPRYRANGKSPALPIAPPKN